MNILRYSFINYLGLLDDIIEKHEHSKVSFINYLGLLDDIIEKHEHSKVQFHKLPWFT